MFFAFQMTSLKEIIDRDNVLRMMEKKYIKFTNMDMVEKFWFLNRTLFAINLGLCGFETNIAYNILKLERVGRNRIILYYTSRGRELLYPLHEMYANIISDRDIEEINSGVKKYKIIRTIRKCNETRLRYDHKSYTWDLEIRPVFLE